MLGLGNGQQRDGDRWTNAAVTRAQLRTRMDRWRESLRQRYRKFTKRQPWQ